jgi:hypothetical protein
MTLAEVRKYLVPQHGGCPPVQGPLAAQPTAAQRGACWSIPTSPSTHAAPWQPAVPLGLQDAPPSAVLPDHGDPHQLMEPLLCRSLQ